MTLIQPQVIFFQHVAAAKIRKGLKENKREVYQSAFYIRRFLGDSLVFPTLFNSMDNKFNHWEHQKKDIFLL